MLLLLFFFYSQQAVLRTVICQMDNTKSERAGRTAAHRKHMKLPDLVCPFKGP